MACCGSSFEQWHSLFHTVRDITDKPLLPGNDMQVLVDGHWALVGSANWDSGSLRLSFEINVECYHRYS